MLVGGYGFEKMGVAKLVGMNNTPPYSLYNWAGLSLFTLGYGGRVDYMETHP